MQRFTKTDFNFTKKSPKMNVNTRAATTTREENKISVESPTDKNELEKTKGLPRLRIYRRCTRKVCL